MQRRDTVLIVDDSVETLNFLSDALESAGFTVLVALNGQSAITLVGRIVPDIVLLDAVMPGLDGFETCRRLKDNSAHNDLPIIFMTGLSETEHIISGFQAGGVDYVTKPIVPDELLARMNRHLATAQSVRSARTASDLAGRYMIAVDSAGRTVWGTPQASRLIGEVLDLGEIGAFTLPDDLLGWLNGPRDGGSGPAKMQIRGQSLQIAYIGKISDKEIILRLSVTDKDGEQKLLRDHFALTDRESEVLLWISGGKSNRDIAEILGLSHRTINKYLDQIYTKLNVENRASAAAMAVRAISDR